MGGGGHAFFCFFAKYTLHLPSGLQYFSIPDSKIWKYNYREWRNIEINQARTLKFYEI
jgi:hypothetical protein